MQIGKVLDSLIKNIFDNSLYVTVHEKNLDLMKGLIDTLFSRNNAPTDNNNHNNLLNIKQIMLSKVLHTVALKFGEIKENFALIKQFIENKSDYEKRVNDSPKID